MGTRAGPWPTGATSAGASVAWRGSHPATHTAAAPADSSSSSCNSPAPTCAGTVSPGSTPSLEAIAAAGAYTTMPEGFAGRDVLHFIVRQHERPLRPGQGLLSAAPDMVR
eukprot:4250885-Prymnesium_polylepis.1